jgi:hypothetical protein
MVAVGTSSGAQTFKQETMKWTNRTPTVVGFYWYEDGMTDRPVIVEVTAEEDGLYATDNCELSWSFLPGLVESSERWSDTPIPTPEEA